MLYLCSLLDRYIFQIKWHQGMKKAQNWMCVSTGDDINLSPPATAWKHMQKNIVRIVNQLVVLRWGFYGTDFDCGLLSDDAM
jgi:hypothetical protein